MTFDRETGVYEGQRKILRRFDPLPVREPRRRGEAPVPVSQGESFCCDGDFIKATTQGLQESDTTSHVITLPAEIDAGNQIVVIFHGTDLGLAAIDVTGWDGFTELTETIVETANDNEKSWVAYKTADGTEGGTTLTITTDVSLTSATSVIVVDAINVPEATSVAGGSNDNPDPPSETYSVSGSSFIVLAAYSTDGPDSAGTPRTTLALPSGYTHLQTVGSTIGSTDGATIGVAFKTVTTGTADPGVFEFSQEDDFWAAHTIILPTVSDGTDADAIHDNVAGEIDAITEATPESGDWVLFEDTSDGDAKKKADAVTFLTGGDGTGGQPYSGAGVKRITSNQTITGNTETVVEFNGEDWDTSTYHDNSTNPSRLTVPAAGKYHVSGHVYLELLDGEQVLVKLLVDGTTARWLFRDNTDGDGGDIVVGFSETVDLTSSQYVEIAVFQLTNNFAVTADRTHVQITRLAPAGTIGDGTELTIATGVITVTTGFHVIDTQNDDATDELDTINGGTIGLLLVLKSAADARDPTVTDGTGNIVLAGGAGFTLSDTDDTIALIYDGTNWLEVSRSDNS